MVVASAALDAQWARLGGGFAVAPSLTRVDLERLLLDSAGAAPQDARLFGVVASWLAVHGKLVHLRRLGRLVDAQRRRGTPSDLLTVAVLGALIEVAVTLASTATFLRAVQQHCRPLAVPQPLFARFAESPTLTTMAQEECLPAFAAWGLWHNSLADKRNAVRPIAWLLRTCPELHMRSLFGADLAAEIMDLVLTQPATIADLARTTGATPPAVHEIVGNLLARGLVERPATGYRKPIRVSPEAVQLVMQSLAAPSTAKDSLSS